MDDYYCMVCGSIPTAIVRSYAHDPFVDGRCYDLICWSCACVPKFWYYDENDEVVVLSNPDADHLRTAEEMMSEGWSRADAEFSIKAVKKLLKSPKVNFESSHGVHIFDQLIFGDTLQMELSL